MNTNGILKNHSDFPNSYTNNNCCCFYVFFCKKCTHFKDFKVDSGNNLNLENVKIKIL